MLLDDYAYSNRWRYVHPAEKGLFTLLCLMAVLSSRSVELTGVIWGVMSGVILLGVRIPLRVYLRLLLVPLPFILVGASALAVSFSGGEIFLGELPLMHLPLSLTLAGIDHAVLVVVRSLGAVTCLFFLGLTTPMTEVVGLLRTLRVPELFLELMVLAYRQIYIFIDTARQIRLAQASRLGYATPGNAWRSLGALGGNLLLRTFRRSQQLHQGMVARGYDDALRYLEVQHVWSVRNLVYGTGVGLFFWILALCLPTVAP